MVVSHVRVVVGPKAISIPFETFYDAHIIAKILSEGCDTEVEVWQGVVKTHVYLEGEQFKQYAGAVQ